MVYVIDTSSFIVVGHYFPDRFPSFWAHFDALADAGRLVSAREVWKELDNFNTRQHLAQWVAARKALFGTPTSEEMAFVARIFEVPRFQSLVKKKKILEGSPAADPWVIAAAAVRQGCVVTEEGENPNQIRIPAVCRHFAVQCCNLQGMMSQEGWQY
jgi:hypothetical protein